MEQQLTPIIKDSFIQFAGAVLQSRALPDVRDCMKPSARQIFYCLYTDKFIHSKPYQKTLKAIGSAFRLYIHGDSSAEGVIMRAAQPFAMRYPLVEVEGSYGTLLAAGSWAAPRYTSSRLTKLSEYLFADINKDTIDEWRDNYDNTEQYPMVLPSKGFFNLVNGSYGIGVGASCSIPQYNLTELNNALCKLLLNPDIDFNEIYCPPDFATGALLLNADEVKESHKNGHGPACKLRSKIDYDFKEHCLVVTEIPYMVYTETICKELEDIIENGKIPGIERFNDLTGEEPKIKIYLSANANPDKIQQELYKNTSLQSYYSINFTMLENGRFPKVFTWRELLQSHIEHEKNVYKRSFNFDLLQIKHKIHILNGLLICLASIEEVIQVIKSSESTSAANKALQDRFLLDEEQAKAVLDMKLSRLANLEIKKIKDEKLSLETECQRIEDILNNEQKFNQELINGWQEVIQKFGDDRKTKLLNITEEDEADNLANVVAEKCVVVLTEGNTLKRIPTKNFTAQRRNGKGVKNQEDITSMVIRTNTLDNLVIFTNKGNMYRLLVDEIPEGTNQSKGYPVDSLVSMTPDEKAQVIYSIYRDTDAKSIMFVTKQGYVKRTSLEEYINVKKKKGIKAITLHDNDEIVTAFLTNNEQILILSKDGYAIRCKGEEFPLGSRISMGYKAINLRDDDCVIAALPIRNPQDDVAIFSNDGLGRRVALKNFTPQTRNGRGTIYAKEANAVAACLVSDGDLVLVCGDKTSICIKAEEIAEATTKYTQGTIIIKGNKQITGVSKI